MFLSKIPPRAAVLTLALAFPSFALAAGDAGENEKPGYLGVRMQRIDGGLAEALDLREDGGVLIGQVLEKSPASEAGLEEGDLVVKVDGRAVGTPDELRDAVRGKTSGEKVSLEVLRDGAARTVSVTLGEASERSDAGRRTSRWVERRGGRDDGDDDGEIERRSPGHGGRGWLGVMTQPLSKELGEFFGVAEGRGALVSEVVKDSPAAKLGLRAGDVITQVDGTAVENPGDLMRAVRGIDASKKTKVVWKREKRERTGEVTLEVREGWGGAGMREAVRSFRDMPRRFERRKARIPREDGVSRFEWRDEDAKSLREEIRTLKEEMRRLKEEMRAE